MGVPLITQNFPVICSGRVVCTGSIGLSILWHKAHLSCPLTLTFVPWGSITSMIYEAFSIKGKANLRQDARAQFGLQEAELTSDLRLTAAAVLRMQWGQHKEQPKAPPARTARRDSPPWSHLTGARRGYTDSEHPSNEQDELLQDATRTPFNEDRAWSHVSSLSRGR